MKKYLICLVMCLVLAASATNAFAAKFSFGVPEDLNIDTAETYTNGEHTMIPLRLVAEDLGYNVLWNGEEMSVAVANDNVNIKIYIGADSYYIESGKGTGMANPVMIGAAPELKDSKTYVPVVMITMLRHYDRLSVTETTIPQATGKITFNVSESLKIDASETYKSGEHTMVPLEKAAKNIGYDVIYNETELSAVIKTENASIKVYVGVDSYFVETTDNAMKNPVTFGTAPEVKGDAMYVPAAMFNLISLYANAQG